MLLRVVDLDAASRFFGAFLGWPQQTEAGHFEAPDGFQPMLELSEGGDGANGFFSIHIEVDDVDALEGSAYWLERVGPGREERPPGRDLLNLRWPGWAYHLGVFAARGGYWRREKGPRFVVVGRVDNLALAIDSLEAIGWSVAHAWNHAPQRGAYMIPTADARAGATLSGSTKGESIEVCVEGMTQPDARLAELIPGLSFR